MFNDKIDQVKQVHGCFLIGDGEDITIKTIMKITHLATPQHRLHQKMAENLKASFLLGTEDELENLRGDAWYRSIAEKNIRERYGINFDRTPNTLDFFIDGKFCNSSAMCKMWLNP